MSTLATCKKRLDKYMEGGGLGRYSGTVVWETCCVVSQDGMVRSAADSLYSYVLNTNLR